MSQVMTYSKLLEFLGLSNWQFILLALIIAILGSFVYFFFKMGLLNSIKFKCYGMESAQMVYISYEGSYDQIGIIFDQCSDDFDMVFKLSEMFGIFYDDPTEAKNPNQCKAIIGILLDPRQTAKIGLFLSKFPMYKKGQFPKNKYFGTVYPYFSSLTFIMILARVYPELTDQAEKNRIEFKENRAVIQIYHIKGKQQDRKVSILIPIQNQKQFMLWYQPTDYSRIKTKID